MSGPQDDHVGDQPRWEAERNRLGRDTPPVLRWLYGQWWLYVLLVGIGLYIALEDTRRGGKPVPGLVIAGLMSLPLLALWRSKR